MHIYNTFFIMCGYKRSIRLNYTNQPRTVNHVGWNFRNFYRAENPGMYLVILTNAALRCKIRNSAAEYLTIAKIGICKIMDSHLTN